jgi:RNA polymerase sigma-70 factor (ECF subfamily)
MDDIGELIGRVSLRDRKAFSTLYSRTSPKLFGIVLRILRDRRDSEEALQEIYVRIWQRSGTFAQGGTNPMGWLSTIARNHAIDMLRARKPAASSIYDQLDLAAAEPDPEMAAVNSGEGRQIERCMETLEADRAEAVRKAYVEGMSYQELADHYRVPLNTMRTWLRRSLLKLRECMQS